MIVFNACVASVVMVGQLVIYAHVQKYHLSVPSYDSESQARRNELVMTHSFAAISTCNAVPWLVAGMLKAFSLQAYSVPDAINVALALVVLPLSSALNPLLHTMVARLERHAINTEERLKRQLLASLKQKKATKRTTKAALQQQAKACTASQAGDVLAHWIITGAISAARV
jgi:hypothetical protein